jgi:hypothetical protein
MRVHSIDYAAFLKSEAVPVAASVVQFVDEPKELSEPAASSDDAGSAPVAAQVAPAKSDVEKPRQKNDGSATQKKNKEKGAVSAKGAPKKGNK